MQQSFFIRLFYFAWLNDILLRMQPAVTSTFMALNTVANPPPALLSYARNQPASPALIAKAKARGLTPEVAEIAAGVLTRVVKCLDDAGRMRKGTYARAKAMETALEACRPPVSDALRLGMVACPVDGRAVLRLWREICEPHERGAMMDLLSGAEAWKVYNAIEENN